MVVGSARGVVENVREMDGRCDGEGRLDSTEIVSKWVDCAGTCGEVVTEMESWKIRRGVPHLTFCVPRAVLGVMHLAFESHQLSMWRLSTAKPSARPSGWSLRRLGRGANGQPWSKDMHLHRGMNPLNRTAHCMWGRHMDPTQQICRDLGCKDGFGATLYETVSDKQPDGDYTFPMSKPRL